MVHSAAFEGQRYLPFPMNPEQRMHMSDFILQFVFAGMQVLEWNGIPLTSKTYEEVQSIISQQSGEAEICVRL